MIKELITFFGRATATPLEGLPAVVIPNDVRIASTIHLAKDAPRKTGTVTAESLDSLVDYIDRHHEDETAIFASAKGDNITAVIDWHNGPETALGGFARHQAVLPLVFTEQWQAWFGISGKAMHQKTLAEFIEEYLDNIVQPDAASVLESVLTLTGKKSVNYKSATRLATGDTAIVWEETTEAKAGQSGDLKVPSELTLRIPVYVGCEAETTFDIRAMFRFNVDAGSLTFVIKMMGIERIRELAFAAVFESLIAKIKAGKIDVPIYRGAVTTTPLQIYSK